MTTQAINGVGGGAAASNAARSAPTRGNNSGATTPAETTPAPNPFITAPNFGIQNHDLAKAATQIGSVGSMAAGALATGMLGAGVTARAQAVGGALASSLGDLAAGAEKLFAGLGKKNQEKLAKLDKDDKMGKGGKGA